MICDSHARQTIYLIRHGQTELNSAGRLRGHMNPALDDTGMKQAEALGTLICQCGVGARHRQPAAARSTNCGADCQSRRRWARDYERLQDRDYGQWAGDVRRDIEARFGSIDQAPRVEGWAAVTARIQQVFFAVTSTASDIQTIAIVAHDATNCALLAALIADLPDDPSTIRQRTGCWNKLIAHGDQWQAAVINARPNDGHKP